MWLYMKLKGGYLKWKNFGIEDITPTSLRFEFVCTKFCALNSLGGKALPPYIFLCDSIETDCNNADIEIMWENQYSQ